MPSYKVFFYSSLFFLVGVFLKSIGLGLEILLITLALGVFFFVAYSTKNNQSFIWLIPLLVFIILGSLFYQWDDNNFNKAFLPEGDTTFEGVVVSNPRVGVSDQNFKLELGGDFRGSLLVSTFRYPSYSYGEKLHISGEVTRDLDQGYKNYLAKRGISGVVYPASTERIDSGYGSSFKSFLYKLRNGAYDTFSRVLPPVKASFINGLTLGGYDGFSDEFRDRMSRSGTTHLVALSGYNVSILIWILMGVFVYIFSRRTSMILVVFSLISFVVMTGAEASVIRAAIMGILTVLAVYSGRVYDVKNAIVFACLVMVLQNPKVLVFDVGFQLSFLAVLGILYLRPLLYKITKLKESESFLNWRENLMVTASAQLAVVPVLISSFGEFSPISLLANVSILELIPITMFLGFIILFFSLIFQPLAFMIGWLASVLLSIEIYLINFFSEIGFLFEFDMGWVGISLYYLGLAAFVYFGNKKLLIN